MQACVYRCVCVCEPESPYPSARAETVGRGTVFRSELLTQMAYSCASAREVSSSQQVDGGVVRGRWLPELEQMSLPTARTMSCYVRLCGYSSESGDFSLSVSESSGEPPSMPHRKHLLNGGTWCNPDMVPRVLRASMFKSGGWRGGPLDDTNRCKLGPPH